MDSIIKTQGESGGGGSSNEEAIKGLCQQILDSFPEEFDEAEAQKQYPNDYSESMNTILVQELARFNKLNKAIVTNLRNIIMGFEGTILLSKDDEEAA